MYEDVKMSREVKRCLKQSEFVSMVDEPVDHRQSIGSCSVQLEQLSDVDGMNDLIGRGLILDVVKTLTPREELLVSMRNGLGGCKGIATLREAGEALDVGPQRASEIEAKAHRKLRHEIMACPAYRDLSSFYSERDLEERRERTNWVEDPASYSHLSISALGRRFLSVDTSVRRETFQRMIKRLEPHRELAISLRYGLEERRPTSLTEIGWALGTSPRGAERLIKEASEDLLRWVLIAEVDEDCIAVHYCDIRARHREFVRQGWNTFILGGSRPRGTPGCLNDWRLEDEWDGWGMARQYVNQNYGNKSGCDNWDLLLGADGEAIRAFKGRRGDREVTRLKKEPVEAKPVPPKPGLLSLAVLRSKIREDE